MGARPTGCEPSNLKTPSLCAAARNIPVHWLFDSEIFAYVTEGNGPQKAPHL